MDSDYKINAMQPSCPRKLGLYVWKTDVDAQNIDASRLKIFGIVIAFFLIDDKYGKSQFFDKTFLLAKISMNVALNMPFLTLSNIEINFIDRELKWSLYIITKALPTTKRMELIGKKVFAIAAFDLDDETYVIHIASLTVSNLGLGVHPFCRA